MDAPAKARRPYAVFDIDGTLVRWQLFHALVDELEAMGHIPSNAYEAVLTARLVWQQRSSTDSYHSYEAAIIKAYLAALQGLEVSVFTEATQHVFNTHKDRVYVFTRDLIASLKAKNYLLFAISGSQEEIVKLLAAHYGFDSVTGSHYEQIRGRFTGKYQLINHFNKVQALKDMQKVFQTTQKASLAIGDSEGDIPLLAAVEKPIAFNPTKTLFEHAKAQRWQIVIERKNVIYTLRNHNGHYLLA